MKKILLSISVLLSMLLLFSCNKENQDPDYPFTVVVKTLEDSIRVNNIYVEVEAPVRGSIPHFEGYTNEKGEVSFTYDQNAILLIRATRGNPKDPTYIGCNEVRLEADTEVIKTVYLMKVDPEIPGC